MQTVVIATFHQRECPSRGHFAETFLNVHIVSQNLSVGVSVDDAGFSQLSLHRIVLT